MHITLSFLGQVHEARLDVIEQSLATIHARRMQLALDGFGTFERAGVLYREREAHHPRCSPSPNKSSPPWKPAASPAKTGPTRHTSPLPAPATALRLRSDAEDDPAFHQSFDATEFRLYQSLTLPGGAQYEVLRAFPL